MYVSDISSPAAGGGGGGANRGSSSKSGSSEGSAVSLPGRFSCRLTSRAADEKVLGLVSLVRRLLAGRSALMLPTSAGGRALASNLFKRDYTILPKGTITNYKGKAYAPKLESEGTSTKVSDMVSCIASASDMPALIFAWTFFSFMARYSG